MLKQNIHTVQLALKEILLAISHWERDFRSILILLEGDFQDLINQPINYSNVLLVLIVKSTSAVSSK